MSERRIYVACLAAYNAGGLHGAWIDASSDREEMLEAIQAMLAASPMPDAEEWRIDDVEGYEGLMSLLSRDSSLGTIAAIEAMFEAAGACESAVCAALKASDSVEEASEMLDNFIGVGRTEADAVESVLEDIVGEWPEVAQRYFDSKAYVRDLRLGGDVAFVEYAYSIFAFWNR